MIPSQLTIARLLVRFAAALLPSPMRQWGRAMRHELEAIDAGDSPIRYAFGCVVGAMHAAIGLHFARTETGEGEADMESGGGFSVRPSMIAGICAAIATGLGIVYLTLADAPVRYSIMNLAALAIGFACVGVSATLGRRFRVPDAAIVLAAAFCLLATALLGTSAGGATRWVSLAGVFIQPSLILVPVLAMCFARTRSLPAILGVIIAAAALALQPDRAMAGALALALVALFAMRRERNTAIAAVAAAGAFGIALLRPDRQPAMPHVDQILYTAFDAHLLAGIAVIAGAGVMLVPALAGWIGDRTNRASHAVFGAIWLAILAAAALGNYPTPLVGYGGSAIIGYVLCLLGWPARASNALGSDGRADQSRSRRRSSHHAMRSAMRFSSPRSVGA